MDYIDFKNQIDSLRNQLQNFIDSWNRNAYTAEQSLEFLQKFQSLNINIDYNAQYSKLLAEYAHELETVRKLYEKNKTEPLLSRNLPPISGRIAWSRQLFRRITTPIRQFAKQSDVIKSEEGKQAVKNYNRMAQVLIEYELVHYHSWCKSIEIIITGLNSTVLVKDTDSDELYLNFDPQINELLKETNHMIKLGLDIPEEAKNLLLIQDKIEKNAEKVKEILIRFKKVINKIPKDLVPLLKPHKEILDNKLKPGLTSVTWTNTNFDEYFTNIKRELDSFDNSSQLVKDILECRVDSSLSEISSTNICDLPADPCSIEEFSKLAEDSIQRTVISMSKNIRFCEAALVEILETLKKNLKEPEINQVKSTDEEYYLCRNSTKGQRCQDCINCYYFNFLSIYLQRNNEALIQSTKFTFDFIKKRLQQNNKYLGGQVIKEKLKNPLFQGDIILAIPNISVRPSLDDMQTNLNKVFQNILKISQDLPEWRHSIKIREMQIKEIEKQAIEEGEDPKVAVSTKMPKALSKVIAEHKDISKLVVSLNNCMNSFKDEVNEILKNFTSFSELWEKEPESSVKDYFAENPLMVDFEAKYRNFKRIQTEIEEFPHQYQVGSIVYLTDNLKIALLQEIVNWKLAFGRAMNEKAARDMKNLMEMIDELQKRLSRPTR